MEKQSQKQFLKAVRNDPDRFAELYDAYAHSVFSYCLKRTLDYDNACDVTSEVFLKAYRSVGNFVWKDVDLKIWLFRITENELRLFYRKRKYLNNIPGALQVPLPSAEEERITAENRISRQAIYQNLHKALETLSEKEKVCISLHYLEGFTMGEISQITARKTGTIKSLIHRGIRKLRNLLESDELLEKRP